MRFDQILILGSGKIACDCVQYSSSKVDPNKITAVETQEAAMSMLEGICERNNVEYRKIIKKEEITEFLLSATKTAKTLIISANNRYLFKNNVLSRKNVEAINFHYALLPHYRGMNLPTWTIYNGEKETGVTWHYMTEEVDHGDIIIQRKIPIDESTTAYDVTREGMKLGSEAFKSFFDGLIDHRISVKKVEYLDEPVYLNKNIPQDGYLQLDKSTDQILRLLRAYDYGRFQILPKLKVKLLGNEYQVERYKINHLDENNDNKKSARRELNFFNETV